MKILFLLNEAPYRGDKNSNALRTAIQQKTSQYNIGEMSTNIIHHGGEMKLCTSCAESREVSSMIVGATLGTLPDLTMWIVEADKNLTF